MSKYLIKLDRLSAWVLFGGMLLYFISGYGMTKGIIDADFASKIHLDFLTYIIMFAFTFHTSFAIHLAFKRWQIWNNFSKSILIIFYILFLLGFVYIDKYYTKDDKVSESSQQSSTVATTSETTQSISAPTVVTAKTFTLTELAKYDGKNGNPAYLAVDGDVYDLSAVFQEGKHFSHFAGKELTNAFYSRHAKSALAKYPIVGTLSK